MKKFTSIILGVFLLLSFLPSDSKAGMLPSRASVPTSKIPVSDEAKTLINRLEEIKEMDKSGMSLYEKKQLRVEKKTARQDLKDMGYGVYLSVGVLLLIIIIILLVIVL